MQAQQLVARSLGKYFDAAVVVIAHPSGNTQQVCLALHKPAEADALHAPANDEAASLNFLFAHVVETLLATSCLARPWNACRAGNYSQKETQQKLRLYGKNLFR